jgi:ABC-type bacteriocin/lantibiotic exporter with double-glycine peptidase domain
MAIIMKGYKINRKKLLIQGIYNSVSEFLPYVGILITLWYGGSMVIDGGSELTAG